MATPPNRDVLTLNEAMEMLDLDPKQGRARQLRAMGVKVFKLGPWSKSAIRVRRSEVEALIR